MFQDSPGNYGAAVYDFQRARRQANLNIILDRLAGRYPYLLSFEDVLKHLKPGGQVERGLQEIPLDAIVGSVGRYADFTRQFLPRHDSDAGRWARVKMGVTSLRGLPAIEVYKVGEAYFVIDGHHRVSIAREQGAGQVEAYVREIKTDVDLSPEDDIRDIILKSEYADFVARTNVDQVKNYEPIRVTGPDQYLKIEDHIRVHRYFMGVDEKREIPYETAVAHWYAEVYLPVVDIIRERNILRDFPGRTEADLYIWILEHRAALQEAIGWWVDPTDVAGDLVQRFSPRLKRIAARIGEKILERLLPANFYSGPDAGAWRQEKLIDRAKVSLFAEILVPLSGKESSWLAFEQAKIIAQREQGRLHGIRVYEQDDFGDEESATQTKNTFDQGIVHAGLSGEMHIVPGSVAKVVIERSQWTDVVVLHLAHPPGPSPLNRLGSGMRSIISRVNGPLIVVPKVSQMEHALLAYDGTPKSREALFIATYIAGMWNVPLTVISVLESRRLSRRTLVQAKNYLEGFGIEPLFVNKRCSVAETILSTAQIHECDFIIMGGYFRHPIRQIIAGSLVDQMLRMSEIPLLICR